MLDEISKRFFWIPDFRHIFPIFDTLYGRPFAFRFAFLKVARKFTPPANLPGKGPAEEEEILLFFYPILISSGREYYFFEQWWCPLGVNFDNFFQENVKS
jgi:hypothetical protein